MNIESDLLLKAIVESTSDGIIIIDCKGSIQFVNESTCALFDYSRKELVGHSINFLLPEGVKPKHHDQYIKKYVETGQAKVIGVGREVEGKRKDGTTFPFWLSVNETRIDGKIFFTGLVHDLTEQKKTERALTALAKDLEGKVAKRTKELARSVNKLLKINLQLETEIKNKEASEIALKHSQESLEVALQQEKNLNEMKSRFLSMASHEFKTPLSAILSSASILKRYTQTEQQDKREKHIEKIKRMIRQLNDVLNDFLSVERLDGNEIETAQGEFDVQDFMTNVIEEMEGVLKQDQTIAVKYLTEVRSIYQDSHILRIILRNLLSNAAKYSDEGKEIKVEISKEGFNLVIKIIDEGIGIPPKDQAYIFTRFYRSTNASNIKGTGLGLAIADRYLNVLGGSISFTSEYKKGSTFIVKLPTKIKDGKE